MPTLKLINRAFLAPFIPLSILLISWFLLNSNLVTHSSDEFILGLTIDMVLLGPVLYYFMIRKSSIPNITIVPIYVLCLIAASYILPLGNQNYLEWIKTWIVPIVELGVLSFIIYKVVQLNRTFRVETKTEPDFYTSLVKASGSIFPGKIADVFAAEIATIYYGLIHWKRRKPGSNEYSYHKESPGLAILAAVIFLVVAETSILHFLIQKWSVTVAWIFTGIGIYSGIQVFGILRSIPQRPIKLSEYELQLRYGIFQECNIPYQLIDKVELTDRETEKSENIRKLSLLGSLESHNLIVHLKSESELSGLWGIKRKCKSIAFHIDDRQAFDHQLSQKMTRD